MIHWGECSLRKARLIRPVVFIFGIESTEKNLSKVIQKPSKKSEFQSQLYELMPSSKYYILRRYWI